MSRRLALLAGTLAVTTLLTGVAAAGAPEPNWPALLPAAPSPDGGPLPPEPGCRTPSVRCIDDEIRQMRDLQQRLGCDHRGVFDTTYLVLTETLRDVLREDPGFFRYPRALETEDALFARYYVDTLRAHAAGKPVPPAWQVAFDTAEHADVSATGDMLLGINAHVQNDMPFVLAALGLRTRHGDSRKVDHDRFNAVLDRAYERVVHAVADRFDPAVSLTNSDATPADDVFGLQLVRGWRENVWRNAERLVNASSDAERALVTEQIQQNAAVQARLIAQATRMPPGYRAVRDEYCRTRAAGDT